MENSKAEKSPCVKETKKTAPKKKEKAPYCQGKKRKPCQNLGLAFDNLVIC